MDPELPIPGLGEQHNIAPIRKLDARLDRFELGYAVSDLIAVEGNAPICQTTPIE
jgi:hypothetical protein